MASTLHARNRPALRRRAARWICSLAGTAADPVAEISEATSLAPAYVRKLLDGSAPGDLRLSTLERIADRLGWKPAEVLCAIDCPDGACEEKCSGAAPIASGAILAMRARWTEAIGVRPRVAEAYRVATDATLRLEYVDLILDLVAALVEHGPRDAIAPIVARLAAEPEDETAAQRATREAFSTRLRALVAKRD